MPTPPKGLHGRHGGPRAVPLGEGLAEGLQRLSCKKKATPVPGRQAAWLFQAVQKAQVEEEDGLEQRPFSRSACSRRQRVGGGGRRETGGGGALTDSPTSSQPRSLAPTSSSTFCALLQDSPVGYMPLSPTLARLVGRIQVRLLLPLLASLHTSCTLSRSSRRRCRRHLRR